MTGNNSENGENVAIRRLELSLPTMLIEGFRMRSLQDVQKLDKVGFNLVMKHLRHQSEDDVRLHRPEHQIHSTFS